MHWLRLGVLFLMSSAIFSVLVISGQSIIKTIAITSTSTNLQQNRELHNLKAALILDENDSSKPHDLILYSYSTDEGNHLTGLNYPLKPQMSLTTGSYIKIISGNPNFKVIPTEIALYNKSSNNNPLYPNPGAGGKWFLNVTPGIYNLQVNSEYTPSNDDVATFVNTIQVLGTTTKTANQLQINTSQGDNNADSIQTQQNQQSVTTTPASSFKIIVQVNGANKDKHDKVVFVTGNPSLHPLKIIQSKLIRYDSSVAGISSAYSTTFDLPKDTIKTGEKFMVCLLSLQTTAFKEPSICKMGINSPAGKPETVIFSTGEFMPTSSNNLIK
jgi:hypothetical protein